MPALQTPRIVFTEQGAARASALEGLRERKAGRPPERPAWHCDLGQIESIVRLVGDPATDQGRIRLAAHQPIPQHLVEPRGRNAVGVGEVEARRDLPPVPRTAPRLDLLAPR